MRFLLRSLLALALLASLACSARAADAPRVLIIGDSLSRGAYATNHTATYASRVITALGSSDRALVQSIRDLDGAEQAWTQAGGAWDVVILEVGINDTISGPLTPAWTERYARLVQAMQPARVVCVTPFDIGVAELAADLAARAEAIRSTPGCLVADVHAATLGRAELRAPIGALTMHGETGRAKDTIHPNDAGHAVVAERILAALRVSVALPVVGA